MLRGFKSYRCLNFALSYVDIQQETFTLLTINNFNMLETEGLVDISLILGNLVDVYLAGSLAVYNVWYRAARTNLFMF